MAVWRRRVRLGELIRWLSTVELADCAWTARIVPPQPRFWLRRPVSELRRRLGGRTTASRCRPWSRGSTRRRPCRDHGAGTGVSMADEISPEVADENSPLRCGLVASVSAWRLDVSEFCEVEIDDGLQGFAGRGLAEGVRQGVDPGGVIGL